MGCCSGFRRLLRLACCLHVAVLAAGAGAAPLPPSECELAKSAVEAPEEESPPWFFLAAIVNSYPRLESEQLIERFLNTPMHLLSPGYKDVRTVGDLRDRHLLWAPHVGIGRVLSDHWAFFVQAGYTAGTVRTKRDNRIILLALPVHTDFEIVRGAAYAGAGLDYFPFGMPRLAEYDSWMARFKAARPSLGTRLTWTYATYEAKAQVGLKRFQNLINYYTEDAWLLPSVNLNAGLDVPMSPRGALTMNAGYTFFDERDFDFAGPSYTIGWKHYFGRSGRAAKAKDGEPGRRSRKRH